MAADLRLKYCGHHETSPHESVDEREVEAEVAAAAEEAEAESDGCCKFGRSSHGVDPIASSCSAVVSDAVSSENPSTKSPSHFAWLSLMVRREEVFRVCTMYYQSCAVVYVHDEHNA